MDFSRVDVPPLIPRSDLAELGITYRRVPNLAVGKDIYCDSKVIFDVVLNKLAIRTVPTSAAVRCGTCAFPTDMLMILLGRGMGGLGFQRLRRHSRAGSRQVNDPKVCR